MSKPIRGVPAGRGFKRLPLDQLWGPGLGQATPLFSAVPVWSGLGATEAARQAFWRRWVQEPLTEGGLGAGAIQGSFRRLPKRTLNGSRAVPK